VCDRCGDNPDPREITVPYAFMRIQRLLSATGINVTMELGTDVGQDVMEGPLAMEEQVLDNEDTERVRFSKGRITLPKRRTKHE
jgi:hypothetical protein